jgi:hypothetical protein
MLRFVVRRLTSNHFHGPGRRFAALGLIRLAPGSFYTGEKRCLRQSNRTLRAKYGLDKALVRAVRPQ